MRTYQGVATRTAYVITGQEADAEDAAQSGFVKAFYALDRFQPDRPFRPWLLKIVANEARNRRRAAEVRWFHSLDLGHGLVTPGQDRDHRRLERMRLPDDLSGRTVLDIGA